MTALAAPVLSTIDDVVRVLADRVPSEVLDRVVLELLDHDDGGPDQELLSLLEQGVVSLSLRRTFGTGFRLVGVRTARAPALQSRLRMAGEAYRACVRVARSGRTLWVIAPDRDFAWLDDVLTGDAPSGQLAVARRAEDPRSVPALRASLDGLLDLGERRGWSGLVDAERLNTAYRVEALLDLAAANPEIVEGPLDALLESQSSLVLAETLLVWFSVDRDTSATADQLHLHVNTVRYRLRRAQELTGIDLADWDQRFLAEVQLRLWQASRSQSRASAGYI